MRNAFKMSLAVLSAFIVLVTLILISFVIVDFIGFRAREGNYESFAGWAVFISSILCLIAACGIIKPGKWTTLLPDTSVIV